MAFKTSGAKRRQKGMKGENTKGLLMIFTGNGKGKTTAAIGLSVRAAGHGMRTCFIQFIKGSWHYGEMDALKRLSDLIDLEVMGRGFTWKSDDLEKDKKEAKNAWEHAKKVILSCDYDIVVLDEFTYAINYSMVDLEDVVETFKKRPQRLHVVVTGRDAPDELIQIADLVTEMKEVKHPFKAGIKAQKGIEF